MRIRFILFGLLALALTVGLAGCDSGGDNGGNGDDPPEDDEVTTVADVVANNDGFSTLDNALGAAELAGALDDENTDYTVFAPTDDAFGSLNTDVLLGSDALGSVLQYHVIEGNSLAAGDLSDGQTVTTLSEDDLTISVDGDGNVSVEGSPVTEADIAADNGVVHAIGDKPLLGNQNLANVVQFTAETGELFGTVGSAGLADAFVNADDWTLFGPNNSTLQNEDLSGFSDSEIQAILQYHVFPDDITSSGDLLQLLEDEGGETTVPTLQGEDLTIAQDGEEIVFNDGQATLDLNNLDYFGSNGILHVIDGLLLPPSFAQPSIAEARGQAREAIAGGEDASPTVTVEGTVTRAFEAYARFQDDSGPTDASGLVVRQTADDTDGDLDDEFRQDIADGNIGPGTVLRVTGAISQFSGLLQFNGDDLESYEIVQQGNPPQAQTVSVTDLGSPDGEDYESELLRVEDLSFPEASGSFESGTTYTVEDANGNTFDFRVQGDDETNVIGESIPGGTFTYEGVLSQFNVFSGVDTDEGYQLVPVRTGDIQ